MSGRIITDEVVDHLVGGGSVCSTGAGVMQIPVLVERVAGNGFRAKGGEPLALCAEGATRTEAIERLRNLIADRLAVGAELIGLDLEKAAHPLAPIPGWTEDDPLLDEWQVAMAAYRQQVEEDPDR